MATADTETRESATLASYLTALAPILPPVAGLDPAQLIDRITAAQELTAYLAADSARATRELIAMSDAEAADRSETRPETRPETAARRRTLGSQIALARKCSPTLGGRFIGFATLLIDDLPNTLHALTTGIIPEWTAMQIVSEVVCLPAADRRTVDQRLAGKLAGKNPAHTAGIARQIVCELNPEAVLARMSKAVSDRRVTIRSAPDGMSFLTAVLPVTQGAATFALLKKTAISARTGGDPRTEGQLMADAMTAAITNTLRPPTSGAGAADNTPAGTGTAAASVALADAPAHAQLTDVRSEVPVDDPVAAIRAAYAAHNAATTSKTADDSPETDTASPEPLTYSRPEPHTPHTGSPDGSEPDGSEPDGWEPDNWEPPDIQNRPGSGTLTPDTGTEFAAVPKPTDLPTGVSVVINLVMTDAALFGTSDTAATMTTTGTVPAPIPAETARNLIRNAPPDTKVWIRRLYTRPDTGRLVAMDSTKRLFNAGLREFLILRDQRCRTPWCGAPIRNLDHLHPHHRGGPTTATNGAGLCQRCNLAKQTHGWKYQPTSDGTITIHTPTGHRYTSPEPTPPAEHNFKGTMITEAG